MGEGVVPPTLTKPLRKQLQFLQIPHTDPENGW
jgi:hypothetical protein